MAKRLVILALLALCTGGLAAGGDTSASVAAVPVGVLTSPSTGQPAEVPPADGEPASSGSSSSSSAAVSASGSSSETVDISSSSSVSPSSLSGSGSGSSSSVTVASPSSSGEQGEELSALSSSPSNAVVVAAASLVEPSADSALDATASSLPSGEQDQQQQESSSSSSAESATPSTQGEEQEQPSDDDDDQNDDEEPQDSTTTKTGQQQQQPRATPASAQGTAGTWKKRRRRPRAPGEEHPSAMAPAAKPLGVRSRAVPPGGAVAGVDSELLHEEEGLSTTVWVLLVLAVVALLPFARKAKRWLAGIRRARFTFAATASDASSKVKDAGEGESGPAIELMDVARRPQDPPKPYFPSLYNSPPYSILDHSLVAKVVSVLPATYACRDWKLLYGSAKHGLSLSTFYRRTAGKGPSLLIIKDSKRAVFGAFISESWKQSATYFGNGDCFVMSLAPEFHVFRWTRKNSFFVMGKEDGIAVGGGNAFAIWVQGQFKGGSSHACETYGSPPLASDVDFDLYDIEVWGFC